MKVSIVTISYNQAPFLEQAIASVLDQDHPDIEYIVVDPGSTDGSRDIIERYRHRISRIIFEPDKGAADGLNKGFAQATGALFFFLNSDDTLLPGAVSRVAAHFAARPQTDILMGHTFIIDAQGRTVRRAYTDKFDARLFAYSGGIICQQGVFFRAGLFAAAGGFNPDNSIAWDAELFHDLMLKARYPLYVEDFLGAFRVYGDSITGSNRMQQKYRAYERARFARIMGRSWRTTDWLFWLFYRVLKHMRNPRALLERLRRGSISAA
jgi:glycosyltransferase involved in cell wall biosynthesis